VVVVVVPNIQGTSFSGLVHVRNGGGSCNGGGWSTDSTVDSGANGGADDEFDDKKEEDKVDSNLFASS
jgi:hypothetical protein